MVAAFSIPLAQQTPPSTRLKIVRGTKMDAVPLPPISPATPLKDRKFNVIHWQLQFDFSKPVAKAPKPILTTHEVLECEKGIRDRDSFIQMIGDKQRYHEMTRISRGEIIKWLNKSTSLRGLQPWEEEQIYRDHMQDTIMKVCRRLELGLFGLPKRGEVISSVFQSATVIGINEKRMAIRIDIDGIESDISIGEFHRLWSLEAPRNGNLMGYYYTFLKMDAPRYVRALDNGNLNAVTLDDDEDNDDADHRSSSVGSLAGRLSELPEFLEGNRQEFAQFVQDYILEWVLFNMRDTEQDMLDADFFRRFWGLGFKIKEIKQQTGYNSTRIADGKARAMKLVMEGIDLNELAEMFGRRVLQGCDC